MLAMGFFLVVVVVDDDVVVVVDDVVVAFAFAIFLLMATFVMIRPTVSGTTSTIIVDMMGVYAHSLAYGFVAQSQQSTRVDELQNRGKAHICFILKESPD